MGYVLVNRKRYARVWNLQPSEHWPLRKWILACSHKHELNGWPSFWLMWRLELSIDSDVYSNDKRVFGWSVAAWTPWFGAILHWKHPSFDVFMGRQTSAELLWKHVRGWRYVEGAVMFSETRKKVWRTWSFSNRLTQVKLTDIR
jgi:hypothetical protein